MPGSNKLTPKVRLEEDEIIYGPVPSRRLGWSLGINVNASKYKICNFDCVYCQCGRTTVKISPSNDLSQWKDENEILSSLEKKLIMLKNENCVFDSITFSGYGENALYPRLESLILKVKKLRDKYFPTIPTRILTNAGLLPYKNVYNALKHLDHTIAKLDASSEEDLQSINRPVRDSPSFKDIIDSLSKYSKNEGKLITQTLIFDSKGQNKPKNSSKEKLEKIAEIIAYINPIQAQIYTLARLPAESYVVPVDFKIIEKLAMEVNRFLGRSCAKAVPNSEIQRKWILERIKQ